MNNSSAKHIFTGVETKSVSLSKGKPRAFPYIRWSSELQTGNSSKSRQSDPIPDYCERRGLDLQPYTIDEGKSARFGDHRKTGKLGELLKRVKSGDFILLEDNDRWSREDALTALTELKTVVFEGITMVITKNGFQEITKENFFKTEVFIPNIIKAILAHEENEKKAVRCRDGWKELKEGAAEGKIMTKTVPGWLRVSDDGSKFEPVQQHWNTLVRIFNGYANGKGIRTIMRELNRDKVPTFARGGQSHGNGWSNTHLRRLLESRNVLGEYEPHKYIDKRRRVPDGAPIPNYYLKPIDPATFYRVQQRLAQNGHPSGSRENVTNLFTGIIRCQTCKGSLVIKQSPAQKGKYNYTSLICARGKSNQSECGHATIQYSWVERAILTLLWSKVVPLMAERDNGAEELAGKEGELRHKENQYANLQSKFLDPELASDAMARAIKTLETQIATLRHEIEALSARLEHNPLANWTQVPNTPEHRLRLASILSEEISAIELDLKTLTGVVKVKDPECEFDLQWDRFQGANTKSFGKHGFKSIGKKFDYLDEILVWKTDKNIKLEFDLDKAA